MKQVEKSGVWPDFFVLGKNPLFDG